MDTPSISPAKRKLLIRNNIFSAIGMMKRHLMLFIANTLIQLYLFSFGKFVFFSFQQLLMAVATAALLFAVIWFWRIKLVKEGDTKSIHPKRLWTDILIINLPFLPAYLSQIASAISYSGPTPSGGNYMTDGIRGLMGLLAMGLFIKEMIGVDIRLGGTRANHLRTRRYTRMENRPEDTIHLSSWCIGFGVGLLAMLLYNGGAQYNVRLSETTRLVRSIYAILTIAMLLYVEFAALRRCYWDPLKHLHGDSKNPLNFLSRIREFIMALPWCFWLTQLMLALIIGKLIVTPALLLDMPMHLAVMHHIACCLFFHYARQHLRGSSTSRAIDWLFKHPALLLTSSFVLLISLGTYLLSQPYASANGTPIPTLDALFTATSAVCVTGLSTVNVGTVFSFKGQAVLMALIQLGGLGVMTVSSFIAITFGHRMGILESVAVTDMTGEQKSSVAKKMIRTIVGITLAIELTGTLVFLLFFYFNNNVLPDGKFIFHRELWESFSMALNAFCNAGFSLQETSYMHLNSQTLPMLTAATLVIVGGIGYGVIVNIWQHYTSRRVRRLQTHDKIVLVVTAMLLLVGTLSILALEYRNTLGGMNFGDKLLNAFFQSASARTAGMNSVDIGAMKPSSQQLMKVLMFIGAAPGSTAGGIRVTTIGVLFLVVYSFFQRRDEVVVNRTTIPPGTIHQAIVVMIMATGLVSLALLMLSLIEPQIPTQELSFEIISAFGTVGLSTGITAKLSSYSKIVIIAIMFIGRVGFLTLLGAIRSQGITPRVKYPPSRVIIG